MKKISALIILSILFIGCSSKDRKVEAGCSSFDKANNLCPKQSYPLQEYYHERSKWNPNKKPKTAGQLSADRYYRQLRAY